MRRYTRQDSNGKGSGSSCENLIGVRVMATPNQAECGTGYPSTLFENVREEVGYKKVPHLKIQNPMQEVRQY